MRPLEEVSAIVNEISRSKVLRVEGKIYSPKGRIEVSPIITKDSLNLMFYDRLSYERDFISSMSLYFDKETTGTNMRTIVFYIIDALGYNEDEIYIKHDEDGKSSGFILYSTTGKYTAMIVDIDKKEVSVIGREGKAESVFIDCNNGLIDVLLALIKYASI